MSAILWSLFGATLLVFASKIPMNIISLRSDQGYDNSHPRLQQDQMEGVGHRAKSAHLNTIEAYPMFVAACLVAELVAPASPISSGLAVAFLPLRLIYIFAYVKNLADLRSFSWGIGYLIVLALLLSPLWA